MGVSLRLRADSLPAFVSNSVPTLPRLRRSWWSPCVRRLQGGISLKNEGKFVQITTSDLSSQNMKVSKIVMQAGEKPGQVSDEEGVRDHKILQFCSIDEKVAKKSLGELEQDFIGALQSFYYDKVPIMSNEEFDNLKEELMWEGSSIVMLSPEEQKFMEVSLAYVAGKPILSDAEYDQLKLSLKRNNSKITFQGPRCSMRSRKVVSDSTVDYLKMTLLNVPAAIVALTLVFFLDDLTGFEITYLLELPEPYSFVFTWFVVLPAVFLIAQAFTNIIIKDALILKGPCPNCGENTMSFFGTILTVPSGGPVNNVKCEKCGSSLLYDLDSRLITLNASKPADDKNSKGPKEAKKKAVTSVN